MSSPKKIIFEEQAREKLVKGLSVLNNVTSVTLGPKGRNVGLEAFSKPSITNDSSNIVSDIEVKDSYLNMGISLGKEVASKMKDTCGDGTTTALILLEAIAFEGCKTIASGSNPTIIKRGIDKALKKIVKNIEEKSTKIKDENSTKQIASVCASGDSDVGEKIAICFKKVGKEGVISIEEGKTTHTQIQYVEGMEFERGYSSPYFCTNMDKMLVELNNPYILITDKKISSIQEILSILQGISTTGKSLLIIADELEADVLSTLVVNKLKNTLQVCSIPAPSFGDNRKEMLEDLAALTGATCISEDKGLLLKNATVEDLGCAEKIIITKDKTTLIEKKSENEVLKNRIDLIEGQIKITESIYDKEKLQNRKAKLSNGVALIQVGAPTEMEMKQKKQRFEDSLNSTRSALEEGVVIGGGVALFRASENLDISDFCFEEQIGAKILCKACLAPLRKIIENSGYDASVMIEKITKEKETFGFDVMQEKVVDLFQASIIDPTKVVKNALINAVSVAGVILLSEALICDDTE